MVVIIPFVAMTSLVEGPISFFFVIYYILKQRRFTYYFANLPSNIYRGTRVPALSKVVQTDKHAMPPKAFSLRAL